jgi:hypothetical protein
LTLLIKFSLWELIIAGFPQKKALEIPLKQISIAFPGLESEEGSKKAFLIE